MFSDMSISRRLFVNLALILSMVVLLFVVAFIAMGRESTARNATQAAMDAVQAFEKVKNQIVQNRLNLRNYALTGSPTYTDEINNGKGRLKQLIAEAEAKSDGISLSGLAQAEERWHQNYAAPLIQKRLQVEAGMDVNLFQAYFMKLEDEYHDTSFDQISAATDAVNQKLKDRRDADRNKALFTTALLIVVAIAVVVGSGFLSYGTAKSIADPLRQLITITREIGEEGDLEQEIGIRRSDEIGELAHHFSSMVGYLREMAVISEAIAGGDLSREVAPRSSRDTLGHAFARMTEGLSTLAKNVRDTAAQVASGSGEVANASEESARTALTASSAIDEVTSTMQEMTINVQNMVRSTQLQSGSVNNTSSSIDQMVASIQRVTDTAKVLLDISDRSRQEMQAGIASMDKTTDGLNRINSSIQGAAGIISVLGQRADDIGKIIEVIDDLAEQTNLLALNAAIEAARAGEHGLGFAVVADEVRKLAEKSAQSTKEISTLIQSIQQEARKAVQNMDQSTVIVNEGLMLGGDLSGALRKISSVVAEVYKFAQEIGAATNEQSVGSSRIAGDARRLNEITNELSSSVEEQATGSQAVVKAMERMRALVQQSTSGSTELAVSAEQMSKMSRKLLDLMDRFKLEPVHAEPAPIASSAVSGSRR